MTPAPPPNRRRAALRLGLLTGGLGVVALLVLVFSPVTADDVRRVVAAAGPWAPVAFIVVSGALALAFVPGPLLSAASGVLFGAALGTVYSVISATLTAIVALLLARRAGSSAVAELSGPRALALADLARRRGFVVVMLQRIIPGVPDAPMSYTFGALGLRVWQIGLGTLLASTPRAFAYTALGEASLTRDAGLATTAVVVASVISLVGVVLGAVVVRRSRSRARVSDPPPPGTP